MCSIGANVDIWLSAVYLHNLPQICSQFGVDPDTVAARLPHTLASTAMLTAPGLLAFGLDSLAALFEPRYAPRCSRPHLSTSDPSFHILLNPCPDHKP